MSVFTCIDGIFKKITATTADVYWYIKIYRYGSLYTTIKVNKGASTTLPSYGIGYATSSNSTTVSYSKGQKITPSADMNLYIVYQYSVKLYKYGSLYKTLTSNSQSSTGSFTLPSYGIGYATSSSSTTVSYTSGSLSSSGTSLYIVYQYSIKLYKYGSLYDTLTSNSQSSTASFTLPTCTPNTGESFYGWTKTSGGTTKDYASGASVTTSGMTLYAIFSYETTSTKMESAGDNTVLTVTIPEACTVTIGGGNSYHGVNNGIGYGGVGGLTFGTEIGSDNAYCMVTANYSTQYITGTTSQGPSIGTYEDNGYSIPLFKLAQTIDVTKGTVIKIKAPANSSTGSGGYDYGYNYYAVGIQYTTVTTNYRSTK